MGEEKGRSGRHGPRPSRRARVHFAYSQAVAITLDWDELERAYGRPLGPQARDQITEACKAYLRNEDAERRAVDAASYVERLQEIGATATKLRELLFPQNPPELTELITAQIVEPINIRDFSELPIIDKDGRDFEPSDTQLADAALAVPDERDGFESSLSRVIEKCRQLLLPDFERGFAPGEVQKRFLEILSDILAQHDLPTGIANDSALADGRESPFVRFYHALVAALPAFANVDPCREGEGLTRDKTRSPKELAAALRNRRGTKRDNHRS